MSPASENGSEIRELAPGEEEVACQLILRVFDKYIGPGFVDAGVKHFKSYVDPQQMAMRREEDHFALVAVNDDEIVGVMEMRRCAHVSLLFVDDTHQGRGIARRLFERAVETCRAMDRLPEKITVNSSQFAVPMYESLGFDRISEPQIINGVVHVPMVANIT